MIKVDTKIVLKKLNGEVIVNADGKDLTLGEVICNVLSSRVSNPTLAYQLAKRFATEDVVELKTEDMIFIKKELEAQSKLDGAYLAIVTGQAIEMLDK